MSLADEFRKLCASKDPILTHEILTALATEADRLQAERDAVVQERDALVEQVSNLEGSLQSVLNAGRYLANIAFNIGQRKLYDTLSARDIEVIKSSLREWDMTLDIIRGKKIGATKEQQ